MTRDAMTGTSRNTGPMLGCIADDYTGATDLSSMLVRAGRRVVQHFGLKSDEPLKATTSETSIDVDAVVIALKSRSVAASRAVQESRAALKLLRSYGASRFFFKYCSTFDSTPDGNIGPVAEALADDLEVDDVWFCPSFPENGRTVYFGHLFVHGVLLSETAMRDHPLNPMTDSNVVRVLQAQSNDRVGLLPLAELRGESAPTSHPAGIRYRIVDAINDDDLRRIARLAVDRRLLTGGSAVARYWAAELFRGHDAKQTPIHDGSATGHGSTGHRSSANPEPTVAKNTPTETPGTVILAGSCSPATREQISAFAEHGPVLPLTVADVGNDVRSIDRIADRVVEWFRGHAERPAALVTSGMDPDAVRSAIRAVGEDRAACLTESLFATIAAKLVRMGARRLIVAGGETSGAVINALDIRVVRIGREIAPGVPWVHTLREPKLSLALKSGNFGRRTFFRDAIANLDLEADGGGGAL